MLSTIIIVVLGCALLTSLYLLHVNVEVKEQLIRRLSLELVDREKAHAAYRRKTTDHINTLRCDLAVERINHHATTCDLEQVMAMNGELFLKVRHLEHERDGLSAAESKAVDDFIHQLWPDMDQA